MACLLLVGLVLFLFWELIVVEQACNDYWQGWVGARCPLASLPGGFVNG